MKILFKSTSKERFQFRFRSLCFKRFACRVDMLFEKIRFFFFFAVEGFVVKMNFE